MKSQIDIFQERFLLINERSNLLLKLVPDEKLFWRPRELSNAYIMFSCGEFVLRSAAAIEQTFGGITTRLWDDPFEWTLPEEISTANLMANYLAEVEATRLKGFTLFKSDADLQKEMPAPEKLKSIFEILLETIARAEHFQGRAFSIVQMFTGEKLPRW